MSYTEQNVREVRRLMDDGWENRLAIRNKLTCGPAQLDKMLTEARARTPWLREGASVPQQQTIRDFARARTKALKDIANRLPVHQRAGMPRCRKKRKALPTLNYTRRGFRLKDGRLHLAGGIVLTVVWSRNLPSAPSSVRVYRDSLGHWYTSFVAAAEVQPLPAASAVIGVDWGVCETATTTSAAHDLPHPQHGRTAARKPARRKPPEGKPESRGYQHAGRQAAKLHKKVARQRQDTARKWAKKVVRDHDAVAVEDFRPTFLARTTMAQGGRRRDRCHQEGRDRDEPQARAGHPSRAPRAHHHGLRIVRSENQARTSSSGTYLHLHRVRPCVFQGQELRARDAGPGWSHPGWC
ncbi:hypothetical protein GCM10009549_29050 [Streptomyces thermoalcalitolerans]|uniref:Probable transposase IS891/IS1136/IS1341 domain-containing protein n=1 Tax=Streptomyces thermoalcalitolerans TaxID=65605 RepID=A0ABN1NQD8_9ACTN